MKKKLLMLGGVDLGVTLCAYAAVMLLAYALEHAEVALVWLWVPVLALLIGYLLIFGACHINDTIWRYASEKDYIRIAATTLGLGTVLSLSMWLSGAVAVRLPYHLLAVALATGGVVLSRLIYRMRCSRQKGGAETSVSGKRLLIVGAGFVGSAMVNDIRRNPRAGLSIVGLVDDNPQKIGCSISGYSVLGSTEDIERICREKDVELIYIAIPSATNTERARILSECAKTNCTVKILPYFSEIEGESDFTRLVRDITPEELLGRDPIQVADDKIYEFVSGTRVMITGGGGSIGSELCRQVAAHSPARLVIVDIYENNAYAIQQELRNRYGDTLNLEVYIASVRDAKKIDYLFSLEKPQIVFHAAAHKHVPLMEVSPEEAIKNNVFGTYNTALAANNHGTDRFVLISTDKAVNPTNIMGASKRVCEMVIQYFSQTSEHTTYAAVRFGNVLGSNGSVIPLFKEQIKQRHDITVTDPRIIRYFMTIPEASQLVLTAGAMASGGEIFVLDMGEPVKIDDLARKMISLSGLVLGRDINIRYIGLRPGEKLYEELLMSEEGLKETLNHKIFISSVLPVPPEVMEGHLEMLRTNIVERVGVSGDEVERLLKVIVPSFQRYVPEKDKKQETPV
ncbi:MAG: polysaccharide biosynthesis protein [Clostridia bacterium]|nr:polysaccharide biosynthesis protein [Clostridia bacterium]